VRRGCSCRWRISASSWSVRVISAKHVHEQERFTDNGWLRDRAVYCSPGPCSPLLHFSLSLVSLSFLYSVYSFLLSLFICPVSTGPTAISIAILPSDSPLRDTTRSKSSFVRTSSYPLMHAYKPHSLCSCPSIYLPMAIDKGGRMPRSEMKLTTSNKSISDASPIHRHVVKKTRTSINP
jgi:hypothetical protein